MQYELPKWYKSVTNHSNETYKLFAMRLQAMVRKAFPHDDHECARQLRYRFCKSLPSEVNHAIEDRGRIKQYLRMGRKLTWLEITEVVETIKMHQRKSRLLSEDARMVTKRHVSVWASQQHKRRFHV